MSKLKEKILVSAKQLFQEKGYEQVSLRAIAEHAGTTIGNLTYHYPQKESLLVAMQLSTQGEALTHFGKMPESAEGILHEIVLMCFLTEEICTRSSFYFCNILQLCRDIPSLKQQVEETREIVYKIHLERFLALRDKGLFRSDVAPGAYESLSCFFLLGVSSWLNLKRLFTDTASQFSIKQVLLANIYSYLTEAGRRAYESILAEKDVLQQEIADHLQKNLL